MKWTGHGHVEGMGEGKVDNGCSGKPEGERPLGKPGLDGSIILKLILKK
jgi:hypothetical protein